MRLTIAGERHIRLEVSAGGLDVAGGDELSPLQLLAASLATCTGAVLLTYGTTAKLDLRGLAVDVRWDYAGAPQRVARYAVTLHLPGTVPVGRHKAILRAAETCTVHRTLQQPPSISTEIATPDAVPAPAPPTVAGRPLASWPEPAPAAPSPVSTACGNGSHHE
ncbi:MAG TPA: OsmC family protein [Chloroflexota bacterium]|jgi:putative redox protein|nr:OsmC family protein [Chloroflexota bacterium]